MTASATHATPGQEWPTQVFVLHGPPKRVLGHTRDFEDSLGGAS